jgi:hypothetical protein
MTDFVYDFLDRKPRILWANTYCLLDSSSGASISVRSILNALASHGWDVGILGATHFDAQNGSKKVAEYLKDKKPASLVKLKDSGLLPVTILLLAPPATIPLMQLRRLCRRMIVSMTRH